VNDLRMRFFTKYILCERYPWPSDMDRFNPLFCPFPAWISIRSLKQQWSYRISTRLKMEPGSMISFLRELSPWAAYWLLQQINVLLHRSHPTNNLLDHPSKRIWPGWFILISWKFGKNISSRIKPIQTNNSIGA